MSRAYDSDFTAASSIDESAAALQENFGFSPATAQWEAYAQGRRGRDDGAQGRGRRRLRRPRRQPARSATRKPKEDDGVWKGGADLVAEIDPTITPELQYVALLADQGLVVTSDNAGVRRDVGPVGLRGRPVARRLDGVGDGRAAGRAGQRDDVGRLRLHRPRHVARRSGRPGAGGRAACRRPAA